MELIKIKDKGLDVVPYIVKRLKEGKIVISPTDTVYGIICDGWNDLSKERIFEVKRRKREKVLTGFVRDIEEAKKFAEIDGKKEEFVKKKWPGRYTFIFRAKRKINFIVSSSNEIGIRIPDHPFLLEVLKHFEILASTSANLSGGKSPSCIDEIDEELKERVDIVVDGGRTDGRESTIWKFVNDKMKLLRGNILFVCEGNSCRSPIAEAILKDIIKDKLKIKVESAGVGIINKGEIPDKTRKVLSEIGINIEKDFSQPLDFRKVEEADIIFVMEERQKEKIISFLPEAEEKITVLDIPDPAGKDFSFYRQIRDIIKEKIEKIVLKRICL